MKTPLRRRPQLEVMEARRLLAVTQFTARELLNSDVGSPSDIVLADLNGDGASDLLFTSHGDSALGWYENRTSSGSAPQRHLVASGIEGAWSVAAGDVDGDGDNDLVAASFNDDTVGWFRNEDGLGTFSPREVITTSADGASSVFLADLDGDNDLDILATSFWNNQVVWFNNLDGVGGFGAPQLISDQVGGAFFVVAGDVDGDLDLDVAVAARSSNSLLWFRNVDGLGQFTLAAEFTNLVQGLQEVHLADVDGDQDLDLVAASWDDERLIWYENLDGDGTFGAERLIATAPGGAQSVAIDDVDGDGDVDFLVGRLEQLFWVNNLGEGQFGTPVDLVGIGGTTVVIGDWDGDGFSDAVAANWDADRLTWYANAAGDGGFSSPQIITRSASGAASVAIGDLNGDANLDVVAASFWDNQLVWFENQNLAGAELYGENRIISDSALRPSWIAVGDIDGDGWLDVLYASAVEGTVAWLRNTNGLGAFGDEQTVTLESGGVAAAALGDVDRDGDLDLVINSVSLGQIGWFENDGTGVFQPLRTIELSAFETQPVMLVDLDSDQDLDLVTGDWFNDQVAWYENLGGGNWGASRLIFGSRFADALAAGDLDGDGDIDLVIGSWDASRQPCIQCENAVGWYANLDGQGNFGPLQVVAVDTQESEPGVVAAADLDGDDDLDLISTTACIIGCDNQIVWWENLDGAGSFSADPQAITTQVQGPRSVVPADLDHDGDIDLAIASFYDDTFAWQENRPATDLNNDGVSDSRDVDTLTRSIWDQTAPASWDFNRDGKVDLLDRASLAHDLLDLVLGDLDGDHDVDSNDLGLFIAGWTGVQEAGEGSSTWLDGDLDGDQDVDSSDLAMMLGAWTGALGAERVDTLWAAALDVSRPSHAEPAPKTDRPKAGRHFVV